MLSFILAAIAALPLLGTPTASDTLPDAYLDAGARQLVEAARARRTDVEGRIERYSTLARSRVTIGMRALRRDRTLYRCDSAARIDWQYGDTIRVELFGAREVTPIFTGDVRAGDGECGGSSFDPTADRLGLALGGGMDVQDSTFLHHPLAPGSERDYRFESGGSTSMRLADGTTIRLRELVVIPRRSEPHLVRGSLWLEDRSYAVVRAVLRLARAFDYERDHDPDPDEDDGGNLPRLLRPLRADLRYVTIEYGLWDQQWWLPRLVALDGEAEVGRLLAVPMRMERRYDSYDIVALPPGETLPEAALLPPDSVCGAPEMGDGEVEGDAPSRPRRRISVTIGDDSTGTGERVGCECTRGRCQVVVTRAAVDSVELVQSDLLPGSAYSEGPALLSQREMEELLEQVASIRAAPWHPGPVVWRTGLQGLDLVRYNRVEGLSVGVAAELDLGPAAVEAVGRIGVADLSPNAEVSGRRESPFSVQRITGYRRLAAAGPVPGFPGFSSTLSAFLFGRDDAEYFRTWGLELSRQPRGFEDGLSWRLFGEFQRGAEHNTDVSLPNLLGDHTFRPNIEAVSAEQFGLDVGVRASRGANPVGWRGTAGASLLASAGTFGFVQPRLTLSGAAPLPFGLLGALNLTGGTTAGDAPPQSLFYLGGGRTVRGYAGNAARGNTFWTARGEVGTDTPIARIVVFSDAGWAGTRDDISADPLLLSAGMGFSFLDGLVRLDVARALRQTERDEGWRVELQMDAGL